MSSKNILRLVSAIILVLLVALVLCAGPAQAQSIDPDIYKELRYRRLLYAVHKSLTSVDDGGSELGGRCAR